jgi:hypothetical protein
VYVHWDEYHRDCYSYETEHEYIKYCEELSKKLKVCTIDVIRLLSCRKKKFNNFFSHLRQWMEAYVPNKSLSLKVSLTILKS